MTTRSSLKTNFAQDAQNTSRKGAKTQRKKSLSEDKFQKHSRSCLFFARFATLRGKSCSGLARLGFRFFSLAVFFSMFHAGACYGEERLEPLTLSEGLRLATENSRLLKIASREKEVFYADSQVARSGYFPKINTSLSQTFMAYQPGAFFGAQTVRTGERSFLSFEVDLRQTLYDFGARSAVYESSKTVLDKARLNIEKIRNVVALDFIVAYLDLLETEKLGAVAEKEVEGLASHLETARSLYREGAITKNDLLQAEVKLSDARQRFIAVGNLRFVVVARINNILARPPGSEVRSVDVPEHVSFGPEIEKAWDAAEKQRIELKEIDHEIRIAGLEETARRSEYYPRFFVQGGYSFTENRFLVHEDNWALVAGLDMNLFSGGSTKAGIAKTVYRRERLHEQRRKLADDVKLEVARSYYDLKNARERSRMTRDAIGQAEENLKINKVRYTEGIGTATDVLDAITLLTTAETNYYSALYEIRRAHAAFLYAMGVELSSEYK